MNKNVIVKIILIVGLSVSIFQDYDPISVCPRLHAADSVPGTPNTYNEEDNSIYLQANSLSAAFRATSKKVLPAVVQVVSIHDQNQKEKKLSMDLFPNMPEELKQDSIGTGFIVDSKGLILTNDHVIADQKSIIVELYDHRRFTPVKICRDSNSDLALIFLDSKEELPSLKLADSDKIEIGDWVLAIGTPLSLESSVSAGIISATKRILDSKLGHQNDSGLYLQTDAAINPGNSGGPLVNLRGEVVGINTSIAGKTGLNHGIGFAIPSNRIRWIMNQLKTYGKVNRAHLGVQVEPISYKDRMDLKLPARQGVRVSTLYKDAPAVRSGLKKNDIILAFDGIALESKEEFRGIIESADVNKEHKISILRDEKNRLELPIRVVIPPENFVAVPQTDNFVQKGSFYKDKTFGLFLIPVTPGSARNLGIKADKGLVILSVSQDGAGQRAGLRVGMLITAINGTALRTTEDFSTALESHKKSDSVKFTVVTKKGASEIIAVPK